MGSFNISCFATNQTIAPGDKCWLLPVHQQSGYPAASVRMKDSGVHPAFAAASSTCYPNAFWQPFACFMPAVYDDYGDAKLVLNEHSRPAALNLLQTMLARCPNVDQGENEYHELPFDLEGYLKKNAPQMLADVRSAEARKIFQAGMSDHDEAMQACWAYISRAAFKGRTFIVNGFGDIRPVQFAVMHDETYQALAAHAQKGKDWEGNTLEVKAFLAMAMRKARAALAEDSRAGEDPVLKQIRFVDAMRDTLDAIDNSPRYPRGLEISCLHEVASLAAGTDTFDAALIEGFSPYLMGRYVIAGLCEYNLRITPMVTSGQDYDNEIGTNYAKLVSHVSKKVAALRSRL